MREELAAVGWRVHTSINAQEALQQLRQERVTAVFCDEVLRGATAAGFLTWSRREQPGSHFFVFGDPELWRGKAKPDGFLSWPPIRSELPVAPGTIVPTEDELLSEEVPLSGTTALMSLEQLLDMLRFSGRDATVRLHGGRGYVYLLEGKVVHASYQVTGTTQTGIAALAVLLTLRDTDFAVDVFTRPSRTSINLPLATAINEAAKLADERRRDEELVSFLLREQPRLGAVVVGYQGAQQPDIGHGAFLQLFSQAVKLLAENRTLLGAVPKSLSVSGERISIAVLALSDTRFVAASVATRVGSGLLRLLERAAAASAESSQPSDSASSAA